MVVPAESIRQLFDYFCDTSPAFRRYCKLPRPHRIGRELDKYVSHDKNGSCPIKQDIQAIERWLSDLERQIAEIF
jgi:hypothetical protein